MPFTAKATLNGASAGSSASADATFFVSAPAVSVRETFSAVEKMDIFERRV